MEKLKASQVSAVRARILAAQSNKCALCGLPCTPDKAVLDHCHSSGAIRGVLHRGCNSLLGKIENNHRRYGVTNLAPFLAGVVPYLHSSHLKYNLLHPSHKTEEEKRLARNAAARKRRANANTTK